MKDKWKFALQRAIRFFMFTVLTITIFVFAAIILNLIIGIPNVGKIKAIGVKFYWDNNATQEVTEINWGMLTAGETYNVILFCKNIKDVSVILNFTTDNWNPPNAETYLHGNWNYTGTVIQPEQVIPIQFELSIDTNVTDTDIEQFSFDYVIGVIEYIP